MVAITSTESGASGRYINLGKPASQNNVAQETIIVYAKPTALGGGGTGGYLLGKFPVGGTGGRRLFTLEVSSYPLFAYGLNSASAGFPSKTSNATITYGNWYHFIATWSGSLNESSINTYQDGADSTQGGNTGTGSITSDSAEDLYLLNRNSALDRYFVGDVAYIARWSRVLDATARANVRANGPLAEPTGLILCWANGQDYGPYGLTPVARSTRVTGSMPPVTALGDAIGGGGVGGTPIQIIKTSGTTWVVPADWNSADNKIEVIGGGGGGQAGSAGGSSTSGGGGAYAKEVNVTLTAGSTVDIQVGIGGESGITAATASWFKNNGGTKVVEAMPGGSGVSTSSGGVGGTAAASTGSVKYSGGSSPAVGNVGGAGGGGAGGPNGDGKGGGTVGGNPAGGSGGGGSNGTSATSGGNVTGGSGNGGNGGHGSAGSGGGTGSTTTAAGGNGTGGGGGGGGYMDLVSKVGSAGGVGGVDPIWGAGYGPSGGGGGGAGTAITGSTAGVGGTASYGGGGGAGGSNIGFSGHGGRSLGGPGIIVITYTPAASPSDISGNATLGTVSAAGTMSTAGASDISGSATLGVLGAAGTISSVAASGTLTSPPFKNNTGTVLASTAGITWFVRQVSDDAAVVTKTGITSNGSGVGSVSDALIVAGTPYRVVVVYPGGAEGMFTATAT